MNKKIPMMPGPMLVLDIGQEDDLVTRAKGKMWINIAKQIVMLITNDYIEKNTQGVWYD